MATGEGRAEEIMENIQLGVTKSSPTEQNTDLKTPCHSLLYNLTTCSLCLDGKYTPILYWKALPRCVTLGLNVPYIISIRVISLLIQI